MKISLLVILLLCGGCMSPKYLRELSEDQAIIRLEIGTPWGVQKVLRVGGTTNMVEIKQDGTLIINPR